MVTEINKHFTGNHKLQTLLFYLFVALILAQRVFLFFTVNIDCIDSDQPFMWAGAIDYSKGQFYEPRFYGQNYNTFMEGFFAVPFIWLGLPGYYALPIATHLIFLFPFLFTASYLFKVGKKMNALLVLAVLLCMPPAFDILNSLPRGFVPAAFFSSFFIVSLLSPYHKKALVLNLLMLVLGYFVSANSLILSLPFLFFLFLHHYNNKQFYMLGAMCMLFFVLLYFLFDYFYVLHPDYIIYGFSHEFSLQHLLANLSNLNQPFAHVSFFIEQNCLPLIAVLAVLAYFLYQKQRKAFYSFLIFIVFLMLSLASAKSRDGSFWPWYSFSRMFIGIPVMIYLMLSLFEFKPGKILALTLFIALFFSGYKLYNFNTNLAGQTDKKLWLGVHLVPLKSITEAVKFYKEKCETEKLNYFLISNGFWLNTYLDYGGPAIDAGFPETQETSAERRYWVRERDRERVIPRFMFISQTPDFDKLVPQTNKFKLQRLDDYGLYLVKENTLKMPDFIAISRHYELRQQ